MTSAAPVPTADRVHANAARELFARAGYTKSGIQEALGRGGEILVRLQDRPAYLRRLAGRTGALETLIRLFVLDDDVEPGDAEEAFAPTRVESLEALGLVEQAEKMLRSRARLIPHGTILIASDLPSNAAPGAEHVAGIHRPSITLANLTVRRQVRTALDMGTGNGIQALLAASHAERVVATDINERALAFAALNAALNGIENIEFRSGSFFEPVAGERFELLVSNPPYVISPESEFLFRDSGLGRDRVSERLVGEVPDHLVEGGFGTIMASWVQAGDDAAVRPGSWVANSGCDAWILHTGIEDRLTAAAAWNRDQASDARSFGAAIDRWVAYFQSEGIDAIAYGGLILRRRAGGSNWVRSRELPDETGSQPEAHLLRLFIGVDASVDHPGETLGDVRVSLAPGATITTRLRRDEDGAWSQPAGELRLDRGMQFTAELDRFSAELLLRLDGPERIAEVLDAFASEHEAAPDRVRASGLTMVRTLLELGFAELRDGEVARDH